MMVIGSRWDGQLSINIDKGLNIMNKLHVTDLLNLELQCEYCGTAEDLKENPDGTDTLQCSRCIELGS